MDPVTGTVLVNWLQVLAAEGPSALLIGLGPTLWRNTIWNSLYYGTMHQLTTQAQEQRRIAEKGGGGGDSGSSGVFSKLLQPSDNAVAEAARCAFCS